METVDHELPDAEVLGTSAGLHLLVRTPSVADETAVEAAAARQGVLVTGLGRYRRSPGPPGFVLGYGHLTEDQLRRGLRAFVAAIRGNQAP